ncbi:unnamed protein product, partial [Anisakis simplex]|uniref:CUE domain-containing protein n=1 Tax=Anisakis simplex TaxID=6269 RepID=A0A0M3JZH9_ANISI
MQGWKTLAMPYLINEQQRDANDLSPRLKPPLDPPAVDELSSIANDFARFFTGIKESQLQSGYSSTKSDHPHSKQLIPWNTFAIPVKKLVPVPPTDDSCSTSKGVNLCGGTKIESKKVEQPTESRKNNGQKNTSNPKSKKEPANKQMLSLLPFKQPSNMPKMSIGIQTSDIIALLDRTNSIDEELQSKLIIKPQLTIIKRLNVEQRIIRKDRSTQTCSDSVPTELDLLLALFPEEAPADLAQVLELGNIDVAVRIFREIGAKMNVFAHFDHVDVGAEDILLSRTYERSRVDSPGEQQQLPVVNAIHASADNNSDFHRKPIRNGFYRMQLSTDMMQNLGQLFGDHDESQRKNTNFVDLPLWQWRQIYQAWQGLPVTGRHGELVVYEDFDDEFPDTLNRINEEFI